MAGYSATPPLKKLGIKEGFRCFLLRAPANYARDLGELPAGARLEIDLTGEFDFMHAFFDDARSFRTQLPRLNARLKKSGMLWISWRKGKVSDLDEMVVRTSGLESGLVDVKVCAVNEVWSGLKFVFRRKDRSCARQL